MNRLRSALALQRLTDDNNVISPQTLASTGTTVFISVASVDDWALIVVAYREVRCDSTSCVIPANHSAKKERSPDSLFFRHHRSHSHFF